MKNKSIIVSGPSGSGKTTLVHSLFDKFPELGFSISATNRPIRKNEIDGVDYHFISTEDFQQHINGGNFVEYEQVYENQFYGTLKEEIDYIWSHNRCVIFDIDAVGGINLKNKFSDDSLSIFIMPESVDILFNKLKSRKTENRESLFRRFGKAEEEMKLSKFFDIIIINKYNESSIVEIENIVKKFLYE